MTSVPHRLQVSYHPDRHQYSFQIITNIGSRGRVFFNSDNLETFISEIIACFEEQEQRPFNLLVKSIYERLPIGRGDISQ